MLKAYQVMKRKYSSGFGSNCECLCHKRTGTVGYCSASHSKSYRSQLLSLSQGHYSLKVSWLYWKKIMMDSNTTTELRFSVDNLQTGNHLCSATCPLSITYGGVVKMYESFSWKRFTFEKNSNSISRSSQIRYGCRRGGHLHT